MALEMLRAPPAQLSEAAVWDRDSGHGPAGCSHP